MADWKQAFCNLCYVNCGLEVATEGRKITRVRGDRANERSQGYLCQKPQRLQWYGEHADRLTTPLRRRPDGTHEPISWDTARADRSIEDLGRPFATVATYPDGKGGRIVDGPRLNLITAHDDCDPIAATPYHKNVAVHLAPVVGAEAKAAEAASARVRAVAAAHASAA